MEGSNAATIASRAWACTIRFNQMTSQSRWGGLEFGDQLARFNIWAANIGVFAEAHASLDYRVRNSAKAKMMMLRLLKSLQRKLQSALDAIETHREKEIHEHSSAVIDTQVDDDQGSESSQSEASKSTAATSESSQPRLSATPSTLFGKRVYEIETSINRLHRLATFIRKSSTHNRNLAATKFAILDENGDDTSSQFEEFALRMVQSRFPLANPVLHKRLSNLILQRRKSLSYQQRHQQKLALAVYAATRQSPHQQSPRPFPGTLPTQPSQSSYKGGSSGANALLQGLVTNRALSATTATAFTATSVPSLPAPSVASSSAVSSNPNAATLPFPPAPKAATNAKEFQCPYCGLLLGIKELKPKRWRKHVINDLEPYICLFERCDIGTQSFRSPKEWLNHMKGHTLQWYCGISSCQNQIFDRQSKFEDHMKLCHSEVCNSSQLSMFVESMRRPATRIFQHCPLCNYVPEIRQHIVTELENSVTLALEKEKDLHNHIATHLEALALFSLPWQDELGGALSSKVTKSDENNSVLKQAEKDEFSGISLSFEDPPKIQDAESEESTAEHIPLPEVPADLPGELEWQFIPDLPYDGHSEDRTLQSFIRRQLSSSIEGLGPKSKEAGEVGIDSNRVELVKICDWLSPVLFKEKHESILSMRPGKINEWFLQSPEITRFIAQAGQILWAPGIPGSGKTLLSSTIIEYLQNFSLSRTLRTSVAYAYCDWREQNSQTTMGLIACFVRQFLEAFWDINGAIPEDILIIYDKHLEDNSRPSKAELIPMLKSVTAGSDQVFIVVDALDECPELTRMEIIDSLEYLEDINLLITSRYLGDIQNRLENAVRVDISPPETDLRRYAEDWIAKKPVLYKNFYALVDEEREKHLSTIVDISKGMFPVVQSLVQTWGDVPRQLRPKGSEPWKISDELEAYYSDVFTRILRTENLVGYLARSILMWTAFSKRPITDRELLDHQETKILSGAVDYRQRALKEHRDLYTSSCAGVLNINSDTGVVSLVHVTMQSHLQQASDVYFPRFQENMTKHCVEYLSRGAFGLGPCASNKTMLERLDQNPFLQYAASEWGHHAFGPGEKDNKEAIIRFLNNDLAVEATIQAKNMPSDWKFYPQSIDSEAYPHGVPGIGLAALFGLATIVEAMMDGSENEKKDAALFWAATGGSADIVEFLLKCGVSPNVLGVVRAAAENGHENVIRKLIEYGADINAKGYEDEGNALQTAAIKGNEKLIRFLLEQGADPNVEGGEVGSVLHIAAVNGDESISQLLLEHGADPNTKGGMYGFALQAAVEEGHENIIRMLLENGASVNLEGGPYGNALQAAAENGDKDVVELLLAHGANIDAMIGGEKYTALQEVARRGLEEMVEFLIDHGANMGSRQRNGQTALHQAAKEDQAAVVALLLRKGANHNIRDQRGFTALDWAKKKNFPEVIDILEAARQQQTTWAGLVIVANANILSQLGPNMVSVVGLSDLSNEIVAKVIDYTPPCSLARLALVSRSFPKLVVARLYSSIFYDPGSEGEVGRFPMSSRIYDLSALVKSLENNEGLRGLVLEAKLKWGRLLGEREANKQAAERLINLLPRLKSLQLIPGHIYFTHMPSASINSLHICMPQGETVSLKLAERLLGNASLRSLRITNVQTWVWVTDVPEEAYLSEDVRYKSQISHLAISSSVCSGAAMDVVLRSPEALTTLHYRYGGKTHPGRDVIMPSTFPGPLISHQSSLEELVIYAQPHQHITLQHPAGNVMETMRNYMRLRRLGLPAWWMVHPDSGAREGDVLGATYADKLVQMLPPKLETLQVQLAEIRLNCRDPRLFEHLARPDNVTEHYSLLLRWLGEIAVWKYDFVPRLKRIIVWSSGPKLPHEEKMLQESGIEATFHEQGISLAFIVCRPEAQELFGVISNL
ncbi:Ankyrin repeat and KH domain-containing protein [Lachnellula suecica]|uniref:Ankyrin repeat and KH domain-containing protein n=1 Tax=Lachnellula suecica TaxID=602035 RepID=A0A8T9CI01_9HELO|nr:Ankyrin repeat and KH domain-containing protein [Lachnellula suecica]